MLFYWSVGRPVEAFDALDAKESIRAKTDLFKAVEETAR